MNKELIKKYKDEFDHWLNGGKLHAKFVNDPWEEAPEDIFSYSTINFILVIDDKYAEFRRALAEGKIIQYYVDGFVGWRDVKSLNQDYMHPGSFRIKPEVPKFKVGDWVIHNGVAKRVTKAVDGYIDSLDNEVAVIMKEESLELWEPEDGKYFWYKNDLVRFHETQANLGLLLESARGCSYYPAEKNFEDYCEPFIGKLPSNLKQDSKNISVE